MSLPLIVRVRLKAFRRWVADAWPVVLLIGVPAAIFSFAWPFPRPGEFRMRLAGFLITVVGVLLVVNGIREKTRAFKLPAISDRVIRWARRLPGFFARTKVTNANAHIMMGTASLSGTGHVTASLTNAPTLEERVTILEDSVRRANDRITQEETERRKEANALREAHTAEMAAREAADRRLEEQVRDLSVGSLDLEWVGVAWVLLGTTLTTFPLEIAGVLGWN